MGILERFFGIKRRSRLDVVVDTAIREFERRHAEAVECLICKAVRAGVDPRKIRIVQQYDQGMFSVKVTYIDENGKGVWLE